MISLKFNPQNHLTNTSFVKIRIIETVKITIFNFSIFFIFRTIFKYKEIALSAKTIVFLIFLIIPICRKQFFDKKSRIPSFYFNQSVLFSIFFNQSENIKGRIVNIETRITDIEAKS